MTNKKINISTKRKLLRKKKRRRKQLLRLSFFLIILFSISITLMFAIKSINNNNTTSNPPNTNFEDENVFTVCIDPGHGDWDIGTEGITGSKEKDITLKVALKLGRFLEKNGIRVVYTRTNDSMGEVKIANDSLKERIRISEIFKCDLFISIHCNSDYDSKDSNGVETWYNPNDSNSQKLADIIQNELATINYTKNRGLKTYTNDEDALAVVEKNTSTSVLIELGFLSNAEDEYYLSSNRGQLECAEYINKAIIKYKEKFITADKNTSEGTPY